MILDIINIEKIYKDNFKVLDNINFSINEGEIFSILGANGAGKTTLIKIMTKLLNPTKGKVKFFERDISTINEDYYKNIGIVLEGSKNLYWYLTAHENIMYFGLLMGLSRSTIIEREKELMTYFDIYENKDLKVSNYSRGMQQKLAIIIALLNSPKLLFLDEPTLGLDVISKRYLIEKLKSLAKDKVVTIILTSHEIDVINDLSDRVLILKNNRVYFLDTLSKLKLLYNNNKYIFEIENNNIDTLNIITSHFNDINIIETNEIIKFESIILDYENLNELIKKFKKYNLNLVGFYKKEISLEDIIINIYRKENSTI